MSPFLVSEGFRHETTLLKIACSKRKVADYTLNKFLHYMLRVAYRSFGTYGRYFVQTPLNPVHLKVTMYRSLN